jgi:hypothetical protein
MSRSLGPCAAPHRHQHSYTEGIVDTETVSIVPINSCAIMSTMVPTTLTELMLAG